MGRWSWSDRNTVEQCKCIGIPWLSRYGYFCGFKSGVIQWKNAAGEVASSIGVEVSVGEGFGGSYLRLFYTAKERTELDYKIDLVTTPCNYGGVRYWFICPLVVRGRACRRRIAKLYLPPGGKYFGCRHCYNLTYESCKEHDKRVDALVKNPGMLLSQMRDGDLKGSLLALKALSRITEKV